MDKQIINANNVKAMFFSKEPIEFKQFKPKEINIINCENPTLHYKREDFNPNKKYTLTMKLSVKNARAIRRLFKVKVPRKLKKAIKKSCPGITSLEISHLVSMTKIRRIKKSRQ